MTGFIIIFAAALLFSAVGFKKYIWFISIGYGFAIAGIGIALLVFYRGQIYSGQMGAGLLVACILFIVYGCRLGSYLAHRELKTTSYGKKMEGEIKVGSTIGIGVHIAIWVSAALLYACMTAPVLFRIENGAETDAFVIIGLILMAIGIVLETASDVQKNLAKKKNPGRFVDTGLYRIVRCPNYLGELVLWTGVFLMCFGGGFGAVQWIVSILGYLGIIYVMFSGARRLELRQERTYGDDPEYRKYSTSVPIMIPLIPLYSVKKYKWMVA